MKMPDESTLRRNFVEDLYKETVQEIRNEIGEGPIWISIDETDRRPRKVCDSVFQAFR